MAKAEQAPVLGEDKRMIDEPKWWPCHPKLPVKRYKKKGAMPEMGVILAPLTRPEDEQTTNMDRKIIYLVDMYQTIDDQSSYVAYGDTDTLLADGWIVD